MNFSPFHGKKNIFYGVFPPLIQSIYHSFIKMESPPPYIVLFLAVTIIVIVAILGLLMLLILINQKRQRTFQESFEALKLDHEKQILKTQVEIQEQTFQHISREIQGNISLSLTLAKLNLHTMEKENKDAVDSTVDHSIDLISEAITDLRDISRSLNSELIQNQGLLKALEMETKRISRSAHIAIDLSIRGEPVYLSCEKEIFIFRIIQEALNNVVKHAKASSVNLDLFYADQQVEINVKDNGIGFNKEGLLTTNGSSAGLSNMENRARLFNGKFSINSEKEKGTELNIVLPFA